MAYTKAEEYNEENNIKYIKFLNEKLKIGIDIKKTEEWILFLEAITTPAFSKIYNESKINKEKNIKINNYQIIEFRGDAVIGYIVVTQMIKKMTVGQMDRKKQDWVSNERLSKIYDELDLKEFVYKQPNVELSLKVKVDIIEGLVYACHFIFLTFQKQQKFM